MATTWHDAFDPADLLAGIKAVKVCAVDKGLEAEKRPVLSSVVIDVRPGRAYVVAADNHRAGAYQVTPIAPADPGHYIVPLSFVPTLERQLANGGAHDVPLETRWHYPNWEAAMPRPGRKASGFVVDQETFARALKFTSVIARESANVIRLHAAPASVTASEMTWTGDASVALPDAESWGMGTVALNATLFREIITGLKGADVEVTWETPLAPLIVTPSDRLRYAVMPVRTSA